jgi:hypothetical protein
MYLPPERLAREAAVTPTSAVHQPRCPACGAPLIELRATFRCSRCYLALCEACAGEPAENLPSAGD